MKKTIGFLSNKLTLRGTETNLYDYADYSETLLGHTLYIITRPYDYVMQYAHHDVHIDAYKKFASRFNILYYITPDDVKRLVKEYNIDLLFIEKGGDPNDGLVFPETPTIIHAVFSTRTPHGTLYSPISAWVNKICSTHFPVLPNIVRVYDTDERLDIVPKDARVFGTYSGADCFDIPYLRQAVVDVASQYSNIYFIFLNIIPFGPCLPNIIFLPGTADMKYKRMFINTCDAMLYGRKDGETFGISCGEFSICNKPVIACLNAESQNHLQVLGDNIIGHRDYQSAVDCIVNFKPKDVSNNGYKKYLPEPVIRLFQAHIEGIFSNFYIQ